MASRTGSLTSTAPATIGTINFGVEPKVMSFPGGVKVVGEDFVTTCSPINSANVNWATVAGFPMTPSGFGNNTMNDLAQNFTEYRVEALAVCFLPAVGTTSSGQVAIYHKPRRVDPHIDPTTNAFFAYVLNSRTGIIGPVWQPLGYKVRTSTSWLTTVPLNNTDPDDECEGEIFIATNNTVATGVAPSIGIIKIQYVVSFRNMERNPRSLLMPLPNQVYFNLALTLSNAALTSGTPVGLPAGGADQSGSTSTDPSNLLNGDVFRFLVDIKRSTVGGTITPTFSNIFKRVMYSNNAYTVQTSQPIYIVATSDTPAIYYLYPTLDNALTGQGALQWQSIGSFTSISLVGVASLIGAIGPRNAITI